MELSDVLKELGYKVEADKELKLEDIKTWHTDTFIGVNVAHEHQGIRDKVVGSTKGAIETKVIRQFKDLGIEIDSDSKLDDVIGEGDKNAFSILKTNMAELKENATKGADDKFKALDLKYTQLTSDHGTVKETNKTLSKDLKEAQKGLKTAKSDFKIQSIVDKSMDKSLISQDFVEDKDIRDSAIDGFMSKFKEKYSWKLDEDSDSPDGLRIEHMTGENKSKRVSIDNKFPTLAELFTTSLKEKKMYKMADKTPPNKIPSYKPKEGENVPKNKAEGWAEQLASVEKKEI